MGGGRSTTTSEANFPPEFRPLATSAVQQIQALQDLLPLAEFGQPVARPVAGLAPFTRAGFELASMVPFSSAAEQGLLDLSIPIGQLARQSLGAVGEPVAATRAALAMLAPQLGTGPTGPRPTGTTESNPLWVPTPFMPSPFTGLTETPAQARAFGANPGNVPFFTLPPIMLPQLPRPVPPMPGLPGLGIPGLPPGPPGLSGTFSSAMLDPGFYAPGYMV
jgi:hypothetical protein